MIMEYYIKTAEDIQNTLCDLLDRIKSGDDGLQNWDAKKEHQMSDSEYHDSRDGNKQKTRRLNYGSVDIRVPQDRNNDYEP